MEIMDYKLQLENFYGPMDLMLHLVKENELNIYDIPIARVTEQYLSYMEIMKKLDINLAGEFIVMASTLMQIKARTLVPVYADEEEEEEDEDPRFELVRRLLEYKKYKDFAVRFRVLMDFQSKTSPRPYTKLETGAEDDESAEKKVELEMWPLVKTYARITKEINLEMPISLLYTDIPIETVIDGIMALLEQKKELLFTDLPRRERSNLSLVRNFLAVLEMARKKAIAVTQEKDFADIKIRFRTSEEVAKYEEDYRRSELANQKPIVPVPAASLTGQTVVPAGEEIDEGNNEEDIVEENASTPGTSGIELTPIPENDLAEQEEKDQKYQ